MQFGVDGRVRLALAQPAHRLLGEQVEADGLAVRRGLAVAGEVEQVGDQLVKLGSLLPGRPYQGGCLRVRESGAVLEQVEVRGETRQRGAQFV